VIKSCLGVGVRSDDFFEEVRGGPWGGNQVVFRTDYVESFILDGTAGVSDLEVGIPLAELVHQNLVAFGTGGGEDVPSGGIRVALRALKAVLDRLGVPHDIPWRDYDSFKAFWIKNGAAGTGGYAARRAILLEIFEPIHAELERLQGQALSSSLAEPISSRPLTGWAKVDIEVSELRRCFRAATSPQDYRNVGNLAMGVLDALNRTVYDPKAHVADGDQPLPLNRSKDRVGAFVRAQAPGGDNKSLRGLVNAAIEFAHSVKHSETPSRRDAGIAGDGAILLANMLRRLVDEG
jgi:hypothetical protein